MKTKFSTTAAVAAGVLMSLPLAGVASADPDLSPIVNTTCGYDQVVSAANAQSPLAAAFLASPQQAAGLRQFLDSPPAQRQQMAEQIANAPANRQNLGLIQQIFSTCNNY
jgi:hemophore-related protein